MTDDPSRKIRRTPPSDGHPRTVTDAEGVAWTVTEAYRFAPTSGVEDLVSAAKFCLVWFENPSGRTASIHLPAGSLATVSDEDLLAFLRVATERKGRQPG